MVNIDDMISLVIFLTFFIMSIAYFSTLQNPTRIELESLAHDIAGKILTPKYLTWNVTKTAIFVNASSAQNLYPIDMRIAFPAQTKSSSIKVRYHANGKDVGFVYANATTHELTMLANLSAGKNMFDVFYSYTDSSQTITTSDLVANGLLFSNSVINGEFSQGGDIVSVSYRNGDNPWVSDGLMAGSATYQATSHTTNLNPVMMQYDFTNGSTTKTFRIYAFNPIIRVNISTGNYTWTQRFSTNINRTFADADHALNGSGAVVFSGSTNFLDAYTSPGITTTGITFSDANMNATILDGASYREIKISNYTGSSYEIYFHSGPYTSGKPYNDLRISLGATQLFTDEVTGIKASMITSLNATDYNTLKKNIGTPKDFSIQIENASDNSILLDYGKSPPGSSDVVVYRNIENLLTADYDLQRVLVRVKTWN
ncbi:MAG: hypothetical protein V1836_02370 [Candidatus Aenigmatarchaeota archaeon]